MVVTTDFEPKKQEKSDKKSEKQEPENYLDYVQQRTEQEELEPAKNLIYKLGMLNVDQKIIEAAILDQYKVAVKKKVGKFTTYLLTLTTCAGGSRYFGLSPA